ncbi:MAG: FliH/SctL family protein [Acidaminobacteraceae bacterium]
MSKIFKASKVVLDNKKFKLSTEIVDPFVLEEIQKNSIPMETSESRLLNSKKVREDTEKHIEEAAIEAREKIEDAKIEHERIILDAYDGAKEILEKAKVDGHSEGYKEGYDLGYSEGKAIYEAEIDEAVQIKKNAVETYKAMIESAESEVIEVVISSIEKILNKTIEEDSSYIEGVIKSALEKCAFTTQLTLRVSKEDFEYANSIKNKIVILVENIDDLIIKMDPALIVGSCVIDTVSGSVDSSVWSQFEQIKAIFEEMLKGD